jgi:hypothetical protein
MLYLFTILFVVAGSRGVGGLGFFLPLIWQGVYAFVVTSTVYYRLGGIRI